MKPAPFDLHTAQSLPDVARYLAAGEGARVLAGGQSLGPMLNLRLARPRTVIAIARLPELVGYSLSDGGLTIGAVVTHAAIAEQRLPTGSHPMLPAIAEGIAYPAVRNRGTIGGSIAHADPAADWVVTLTALDATVLTWSATGGRGIPMRRFMRAAYTTALRPGEIVQAIHLPALPASSRWGYFKACRKPGEFAHAMAAVLRDEALGTARLVIGATGGAPLIFEAHEAHPERAAVAIKDTIQDPITAQFQIAAIRRAWASAA